MPGLDGGHVEKGASILPLNSRLEVQGVKEGQAKCWFLVHMLQLCSAQRQMPPDLDPRKGPLGQWYQENRSRWALQVGKGTTS